MHQTEHVHRLILREVVQHNHSAPTMTQKLTQSEIYLRVVCKYFEIAEYSTGTVNKFRNLTTVRGKKSYIFSGSQLYPAMQSLNAPVI